MNTIGDDDLVLYHYRDGLDATRLDEIRDALAASPALRDRLASIEHVLARVDAEPVPEAEPDFEARLWRKLEPLLVAFGHDLVEQFARQRPAVACECGEQFLDVYPAGGL